MKTRPLFTTVLACAVSCGLGSAAIAAPSPTASPYPTASPSASPSSAGQTGRPPLELYNGFLLGSKIQGAHIKNLQKEDVGTIKDLIVNPDTGRVRFAVLSIGGFLGAGDTEVAVPWGAIWPEKNQPGQAPSYVIDATKDRLKSAPKFDPNKLSELYSESRPLFDYYSVTFFEDLPAASPSPSPGSSASPSPSPTPYATPSPSPKP